MSESPVETLEYALGLHLISTEELTSFGELKRHADLNGSKRDNS